jgi:hypothetical protein
MFPKDLIDGIKNFKDLTYRGSFIYFPWIHKNQTKAQLYAFSKNSTTLQHLKNHMKKKIYTNTQFFSGVETEDESYLNE